MKPTKEHDIKNCGIFRDTYFLYYFCFIRQFLRILHTQKTTLATNDTQHTHTKNYLK